MQFKPENEYYFPIEIVGPGLPRAIRKAYTSDDARVREKDSAITLFISIEGLTR
jgi:hypothetical protein